MLLTDRGQADVLPQTRTHTVESSIAARYGKPIYLWSRIDPIFVAVRHPLTCRGVRYPRIQEDDSEPNC